MVSVNKVMIIGRITRDPEVRYTQGGSAVANFGVALNRTYKVKDELKEETTFVDVCAWGKTAEFVNKYFNKGKNIFIEGRLNMREWEGQDGMKRSKLEVVADNIQFVGDKNGS